MIISQSRHSATSANDKFSGAVSNQRDRFKASLMTSPRCTDDFSYGIRPRKTDAAIQHRYIEVNPQNSLNWLMYDVDRPTCVDEITDDLDLPAPHFIVQNPANNHAHVFYGLETSVHFNASSSQAAIRYAGAIDTAITIKLGADRAYGGLMAKNPLHDHWRTGVINCEPYTLGYMHEYLDLTAFGANCESLPDVGVVSRNVNLFDRLRTWAYKAIRQGWPDIEQWERACFDRARAYNQTENPLPISEVKAASKSVARWTHRNMTPEGFSRSQAARGARKGQAERDAKLQAVIEMSLQGHSQVSIANTLGLPRTTVRRWLKRSD